MQQLNNAQFLNVLFAHIKNLTILVFVIFVDRSKKSKLIIYLQSGSFIKITKLSI